MDLYLILSKNRYNGNTADGGRLDSQEYLARAMGLKSNQF